MGEIWPKILNILAAYMYFLTALSIDWDLIWSESDSQPYLAYYAQARQAQNK